MKHVRRYDLGKIDKAEVTPQGFLKVPVFATKTGVFVYRDASGGEIRELRLPEEVFNEKSMSTLAGAPITDDHPQDFVGPTNAKDLMKGFVSDKIEKQNEFIKAYATITNDELIRTIQLGKNQVSCGYECELEQKSGTHDGEAYDFIQRNIVYNHLAVVDRGRAGPEVRLRMDSSDAMMIEEQENLTKTTGGKSMEKFMLNGKEFEVAPELALAIKAMMTEMEDLKGKMADMSAMEKDTQDQKDEGALKEMNDQLQAKVDALTEEVKTFKEKNHDADIEKKVRERLSLIKNAEKVVSDEVKTKLDTMSDMEIKKAVIIACSPKAELNEKTDSYVQARYDMAVETIDEHVNDELGNTILENRKNKDGEDSDSEKARKKYQDAALKAWEKPLSMVKEA